VIYRLAIKLLSARIVAIRYNPISNNESLEAKITSEGDFLTVSDR
jgi:hypothetical protein